MRDIPLGGYLGAVCKRGHDHGGGSVRYTDKSCIECKADALLAFRLANPQRWSAYVRKSYRKHPAKRRTRALEYQREHRAECRRRVAQRNAQKLRATPTWANQFFIDEIYDLATLRTKLLGTPWEVDHIVPLKSPIVCGLHVEHNLRVVPASVNRTKSNLLEIQQ